MKTTTTLLIALGLVSSSALAQLKAPADSAAQPGAQATSPSGSRTEASSGAAGAQPGTPADTQSQPGAAASGGTTAPGTTGSSGSQAGAQSGMPGYPPATSGGSDSQMRSGATRDSQAMPSSGASASGSRSGAGTAATGQSSPEGQAALAALEPKTENDIRYVCGGVGELERAHMLSEAGKYDMLVSFAGRDGAALADVDVQIADARGKTVLRTTCGGPMMLVDVPQAGTYRVTADASGHKQGHTVSVKDGGGQRVALAWPNQFARAHEAVTTATGSGPTPSGAAGAGGDTPRK